ncbi:MAG: FliM/FliN family flagellar motor C-terminal domain-containing protein [Planctomycetaceae bacterium]|jgi:flagellar motor switch/type III secretory pathway protein FliN|nr:FliM/FliN family flagellar motor C-terminal domain-containing protein [Planctomycetaceae bacterium]
MPELNSSAVDSFTSAVQNGAEESASSFARTFGADITIQPKSGGSFNVGDFAHHEKGLALLLRVGSQGIAVLIPSSTGLVPDWCSNPDATGKSKLSTFAQEWGMNLVPDDFFPEDSKAGMIQDLSQGILRGMPELDAGYLELQLTQAGSEPVSAYLIWALSAPDKLLEEPAPAEVIPPAPPFGGAPTFGGQSDPFAAPGFGGDHFDSPNFAGSGVPLPHRRRLEDLPGYTRSALKVKIPVAAVLATGRKPIKTVLELGVGSVIQFDKSCEEFLDIEVGQKITIATAEAVKVGDKYGFRINAVVLPEERFRPVEVRREGEYRTKSDSPQIIGKAPIKTFDKSVR